MIGMLAALPRGMDYARGSQALIASATHLLPNAATVFVLQLSMTEGDRRGELRRQSTGAGSGLETPSVASLGDHAFGGIGEVSARGPRSQGREVEPGTTSPPLLATKWLERGRSPQVCDLEPTASGSRSRARVSARSERPPQYLRHRSATPLPFHLLAAGADAVAFGWSPTTPAAEASGRSRKRSHRSASAGASPVQLSTQ